MEVVVVVVVVVVVEAVVLEVVVLLVVFSLAYPHQHSVIHSRTDDDIYKENDWAYTTLVFLLLWVLKWLPLSH